MTSKTTNLVAKSHRAAAGKQFVARIEGRGHGAAGMYRFCLTYIGERGGTETSADVGPGLYVTRTLTRANKVRGPVDSSTDSYFVVWMDADGARASEITESAALSLAGSPASAIDAAGREVRILFHEQELRNASSKPDDATINIVRPIAHLGTGAHTYGALRAARLADIARLRGESPELPVETDRLPSSQPHRSEALRRRVADLKAELAAAERELAELA